jgi:hypothetical protein
VKDPTTKHHQMATTGTVHEKKGGHVHMHDLGGHDHHGHKEVEEHHPKEHHGGHHHNETGEHNEVRMHKGAGHGGKSIHHQHAGHVSHEEAHTSSIDGESKARKHKY